MLTIEILKGYIHFLLVQENILFVIIIHTIPKHYLLHEMERFEILSITIENLRHIKEHIFYMILII